MLPGTGMPLLEPEASRSDSGDVTVHATFKGLEGSLSIINGGAGVVFIPEVSRTWRSRHVQFAIQLLCTVLYRRVCTLPYAGSTTTPCNVLLLWPFCLEWAISSEPLSHC